MQKILIIITWWTIDSIYSPAQDTVVPNKESIIPDYLTSIKPYFDFRIENLCMKDSRNITNEDRRDMVKIIEECEEDCILITHWTYTMPDTARYLEEHLGTTDKKILLTWSMIPIVWFSPSDWWFNLWFAIGSFQSIEHWVYVSMNARNYAPQEVLKTLNEWRFSSLHDN